MSTVLLHTPLQAADWLRERVRGDLSGDSRKLKSGDGFLAWPGRRHDARSDVPAAFDLGASACVVEQDGWQGGMHEETAQSVATYAQLKPASGWIADAFYGHPSRELPVIAVTGTNGKTSTSWWLGRVLSELGQSCAVAGTLGLGHVTAWPEQRQLKMQPQPEHDGLTTPDAIALHRQLRRWVQQGVKACVMEASSIGLVEHRLAGLRVHTAVFTNLTPDHLDYHGSFEAYGQAKASLFEHEGVKVAVIQVDDPFGQALAERIRVQRPEVDIWTVSSQVDQSRSISARVRLGSVEALPGGEGQRFEIHWQAQVQSIRTPLMGRFNIDNLLLVWATLMAWGHPPEAAARELQALLPVPGRMQRLGGGGQPHVVVDYAHTPDAVRQLLQQVNQLAQHTQGRVLTVLGCGGDRDVTKRPVMAREAQRASHHFWLTSDNPRSEDPARIAQDMQAGLSGHEAVTLELRRDQAIAQAIAHACERDWVVIAGKGHEAYQEIQGVRHPFDDVAQARLALQSWRAA